MDAAQLVLITPDSGPEGGRLQGSARVMTWNVQHAAPARSRRQAVWVAQSGADVVVLTEVGAGAGGVALAQALSEHGFRTHTPTAASAASRDYRVLLACRGGTLDIIDGLRAGDLPHRCTTVRVRLHRPGWADQELPDDNNGVGDVGAGASTEAGAELVVVGLYVPSRGPQERRNVDKRAFQSAVTALLPEVAALAAHDVPVVITGDLNVVEPGHVPPHPNFGAWEYGFYDSFAGHGFADAFRHLHPDAREHSWFGRRSGAGYRFDHVFLDRGQLPYLTGCSYDHSPRLEGLSDHAALTATLALGRNRTTAIHQA